MKLGQYLSLDDGIKPYKAPKGFQYLITSLLVSFTEIKDAAAVRNISVSIIDYEMENFKAVLGRSLAHVIYFCGINSTVHNQPTNFQVVDINQLTKYFTIHASHTASDTGIAVVTVYGELVPISQIDAIWEFITKATI